ncbi:hypothetical protein [Streptomyces tanashiensis]|uniref:hypothetical protein n=1 Tax=Streptomyces tanashiensis TaxID=67367 RepID=UPI00342D0BB7
MSKKWLTLLAVPAFLVGSGTPAVADSTGEMTALTDQAVYLYSDGKLAGALHFYDDGDDFGLFDYLADGHGVRAYIEVSAGTEHWYEWGSFYNGKGADAGGVYKTDGNLYSINVYRMKVCTVDGASDTTPIKCSAWQKIVE